MCKSLLVIIFKNMEGFNAPKTKERPTDEPEIFLSGEEKKEEGEREVIKLFEELASRPFSLSGIERVKREPKLRNLSEIFA